MKPHVQAWFTIPFNPAQVSDARALMDGVLSTEANKGFDELTQEEFDAITDRLKGEYIVEVKRAGEQVNLTDAMPVYMRVPFDSVIAAQIQAWVVSQEGFNPAEVKVESGDVLVEVRAECCGTCSTGHACDCTVFDPF